VTEACHGRNRVAKGEVLQGLSISFLAEYCTISLGIGPVTYECFIHYNTEALKVLGEAYLNYFPVFSYFHERLVETQEFIIQIISCIFTYLVSF